MKKAKDLLKSLWLMIYMIGLSFTLHYYNNRDYQHFICRDGQKYCTIKKNMFGNYQYSESVKLKAELDAEADLAKKEGFKVLQSYSQYETSSYKTAEEVIKSLK